MKEKDERILLDLGQYNVSEGDIPLDYSMNEREKKNFPDLVSMDDLELTAHISGASDLYTLTLSAEGTITVRDVHDGKHKKLDIEDSMEATIAPKDPDNSDLLPEPDGNYDLRSAILALLFDCIPTNYSSVPLKRVETADYVLISEDEYEEEKKNRTNPFSSIEEEDYSDEEDAKIASDKKK